MKFNTIIGNPPYNNDIYLEFMEMANRISTEYTSMIVPSKWQTKNSKRSEDIRTWVVPYMRKIVYYPDCLEIFGISEAAGVAYYITEKSRFSAVEVINKCHFQPLVNSSAIRSIARGESLWNIGNEIISRINCDKYDLCIIDEQDRLKYTVNISKMWCGSRVSSGAWDFKTSAIKPEYIGRGGVVFNPNGDIRVLGKIRVLLDGEQSESESSYNIFTSNNEAEINSYLSWLNTKLVSFILLADLASSTIISKHAWRNIPEPGEFDHIFTDAEMYQRYGLSDNEIRVIEAIIK